jgi:Asp-tRNA(Asn)/Glu-tRNA(Gln) amidotransferase A subunit family amidase
MSCHEARPGAAAGAPDIDLRDDLVTLDALEAGRAIREGRCTSEELVRACLGRIAERDPGIRAWVRLSPSAIKEACELDRTPSRSPLHGVPVAIKDIIDTSQLGTEYGSRLFAEHVPATDAACVRALREAGCVILGKTATSEFATGHPAETRNPRYPGRTPGGSSSGSAAAVADYQVPFALGTQTSGSISRPAAFCGIVGLKPTYGSIALGGIAPLAPALDTVGVLARSPEDAAAVSTLLAGLEAAPSDLPIARIGWIPTPWYELVDEPTRQHLAALMDASRPGGGQIEEVALPAGSLEELAEIQQVLFDIGCAQNLAWILDQPPEGASQQLRAKVARAMSRSEKERDWAVRRRRELSGVFADIWREVDVLLAPGCLGPPPEGLEDAGSPLLYRPWTALGTPTMVLPGPTARAGTPTACQLIAAPRQDHVLPEPARWSLNVTTHAAGPHLEDDQ